MGKQYQFNYKNEKFEVNIYVIAESLEQAEDYRNGVLGFYINPSRARSLIFFEPGQQKHLRTLGQTDCQTIGSSDFTIVEISSDQFNCDTSYMKEGEVMLTYKRFGLALVVNNDVFQVNIRELPSLQNKVTTPCL